jgi:hypothetical protein
MRIAGLFGLAAVMLAVIVTVAPRASLMTNDLSAEVYGIDFRTSAQPLQTAAAR